MLSVLAVTALLHFQLQAVGTADLLPKPAAELRPTAVVPTPPSPEPSPPSPPPPPSPPVATLLQPAAASAPEAAAAAAQLTATTESPPELDDGEALPADDEDAGPPFEDGEVVGPPSSATLCVLMPVRSNNLGRAVRAVRAWERARAAPCGGGGAGSSDAAAAAAAVADLAFFHSQSYEGEDMRLGRALLASLRAYSDAPRARAWAPTACVGAVRLLAARIPLATDVYTIYPTHNFTGPNTHFLRAFDRLQALAKAGVAKYSHFQLLESDNYPVRPGWLPALAALAPKGKAWARQLGGKRPPPRLTTAPPPPPWAVCRLGPRLRTPERRLGILEAYRGLRSSPQAGPKLRILHFQPPGARVTVALHPAERAGEKLARPRPTSHVISRDLARPLM